MLSALPPIQFCRLTVGKLGNHDMDRAFAHGKTFISAHFPIGDVLGLQRRKNSLWSTFGGCWDDDDFLQTVKTALAYRSRYAHLLTRSGFVLIIDIDALVTPPLV